MLEVPAFQLLCVARADFIEGASAWRLWSKFGWLDLLSRYRRSWIGPLWLLLSAAIFMAVLTIVYATLFHIALDTFLPFVAVGLVTWGFIAAVAGESSMTFVESESYIRQVRISPFVYVFRVLWRNIVVFIHQFLVAIVVLIIGNNLSLHTLPLAAVGLCLLFLQAVWVIPLLGLIGTRFRDAQSIVQNLLQVAFFVTPVFWPPSSLGNRRWIADYNPFNSLLEVVREPLLGHVPAIASYATVLLITVFGFTLAGILYGLFRNRIVYWL